MTVPTPLELLETICDEIFERWDKDQRSGKLLAALSGRLPNYRADVTALRYAISHAPGSQQQVTKHRPDPELDRTLSAVSGAMNEPQPGG